MTFRAKLLASTTLLGMASLVPIQAQAGLLSALATVQAQYYNGVFASPELEDAVSTGNAIPVSLATAQSFLQGPADGSTITVGNTQITITNMVSFPFCLANTLGTACTDVIDGFNFAFTGENILGVSVDPSSAADFQPVNGTFQGHTHLGLQLLNANDVQVDVTGDAPARGDQLVLDLTFSLPPPPPPPPTPPPPPPPAPTPAPEPGTLAVLGAALAGLSAVRRRRAR
jgi:PEP-CTERM motif